MAWRHRWTLGLLVTALGQGTAAAWLSVSTQITRVNLSGVFLAQGILGGVAYCLAVAVLIPFARVLAPRRYLARALEGAGVFCMVLTVQALALAALVAAPVLPGSWWGHLLSEAAGLENSRPLLPSAWLAISLPDMPFLLAAVLTLKAIDFRARRLCVATLACGMLSWSFLAVIARPILTR